MNKYQNIAYPAYILQEQALRRNLGLIQQVKESAGIDIILAFKGFALWQAFPIVREYIQGATASSLYEARLCFEEMQTLAHTYAPVYTQADFPDIVRMSSHITFNSLAQFETFYPQTIQGDRKISCGLRVNPEQSDVSTDLYNPSSPKSRLGILQEQLPEELPEGVEGLHFHVLCESSAESLEDVLEAFVKRFGNYLPKIKWVNMGGGHLMTRQGYNTDHLIRILKDFRSKYGVQVILEPGSAFAWETGVLVAEVQDIVQSRGVQTAMLDVSFTAHMPDTLEMPYRPRVEGAKDPDADSQHLYRLGGCSCLAGDYMEAYDFGRELKVGEKIVFHDMIHYTMVKTTMFNGVQHPAIVLERPDGSLDVLRRFGYKDYKGRLS